MLSTVNEIWERERDLYWCLLLSVEKGQGEKTREYVLKCGLIFEKKQIKTGKLSQISDSFFS